MNGSVTAEFKIGAVDELDRIASKAVVIMQQEVMRGQKYATGKLAGSIHKENTGEFVREVGTNLYYAKYVNDGRGDVYPNPGTPPFDHALYLKGLNIYRYHAGPAKGKHFDQATVDRLEGGS